MQKYEYSPPPPKKRVNTFYDPEFSHAFSQYFRVYIKKLYVIDDLLMIFNFHSTIYMCMVLDAILSIVLQHLGLKGYILL